MLTSCHFSINRNYGGGEEGKKKKENLEYYYTYVTERVVFTSLSLSVIIVSGDLVSITHKF